jgi:hypothetical protein
LCGTPAGPACNADLYAGAGYYGATSGGGGGGSAFSPISFDSASVTYTLTGFGGAEDSTVVTDPAGGANKVAKVVKSAAAQSWAGTTVSTGANSSVGKIAFDAANTRMTVRVYSPNAGIKVRLKVEDAADPAHSVETEATTATSNAWETLTFDFATPVTGTPALNFTYTYDKVTIFFNFGVDGATAGAKTYYFDDVTFIGGTGGGGGGGGFVNGIFADDYVGDLPATAKSTQGGDVGFFFDPRLAVNVGATYDYAGVSGTAQDPQGVHNFYYGLGLNAPAIIDAYFGAYIKSPGNGTVDVSGFANIKVNVWGPDQLFKPGTFPALNVILQGPAVAGCGSASGGSEVETTFNTTGQGADKIYTLLLSGFTLKSACSGETTVAQVLASIAQINIVLKNANIQYVNKDPGGVAFTNGLNVGSIKFE